MADQTDQDRAARLARIRRHHDSGMHCDTFISDECWLLAEVDRLAEERDRARREGYASGVEDAANAVREGAVSAALSWALAKGGAPSKYLAERIRALAAGGEPGEVG